MRNDSNFWLATHVTTINIGYASGLLAAVLANGWVLIRVLRLAHPSEPMANSVVRMICGVTAFSLVFNVVGTILGGVWANDSWGRFWVWDPKENGALLICLAQIAMLHARFIGWIRDFGMVIWSSITGMVVMFSRFHTNLLQVGLHSYGFSAGLRNAVWMTYAIEVAFMAIGTLDVLLRPKPVQRRAPVGNAAAGGMAGSRWAELAFCRQCGVGTLGLRRFDRSLGGQRGILRKPLQGVVGSERPGVSPNRCGPAVGSGWPAAMAGRRQWWVGTIGPCRPRMVRARSWFDQLTPWQDREDLSHPVGRVLHTDRFGQLQRDGDRLPRAIAGLGRSGVRDPDPW
jgi:hypothetical protein